MKAISTSVAADRPSAVTAIVTALRVVTALFLTAMLLFACSRPKEQTLITSANAAPAQPDHEELVKRGAYLVTIMGCNDCHTPKIFTPHGMELDSSRLLSGHPADEKLAPIPGGQGFMHFSPGLTAAVGPWGVSFTANLTPDPLGLGGWSYDQFKTAITHGKYRGIEGGRSLLPPMPWQNLVNIHDEDARAIFAYLQSLKPVSNQVPAPIPPSDMIVSR
ncbi:diheme cytochrome c-553 [Chryseolinea sp. T2]|uniref:diheme cytochrome c-553 n=1 Tax=Chryseolinea sp. T2 TaxID=3129255 RepID=UPI0030789863